MKVESTTRAFCLALVLLSTWAMRLDAATWYVATSGNDSDNGTNWLTAKQSIQAAVDSSSDGDTVLVTNGTYDVGYDPNTRSRVLVNKAITVRSVNGPDVTIISGGVILGDNYRCVYLGGTASLSGFTLSNGITQFAHDQLFFEAGGGAFCEPGAVISNCTITGNQAYNYGGGVYGGTLYNCAIIGNISDSTGVAGDFYGGGGAYGSTLNNCTIVGNSTLPIF